MEGGQGSKHYLRANPAILVADEVTIGLSFIWWSCSQNLFSNDTTFVDRELE